MTGPTHRPGPSDGNERWWRDSFRDAAPYLGLGMQLAAAVLAFFFVGWWVDRSYGSAPFGMLAGVMIGLTGGMIKFVRTVSSPEFRSRVTGGDEQD